MSTQIPSRSTYYYRIKQFHKAWNIQDKYCRIVLVSLQGHIAELFANFFPIVNIVISVSQIYFNPPLEAICNQELSFMEYCEFLQYTLPDQPASVHLIEYASFISGDALFYTIIFCSFHIRVAFQSVQSFLIYFYPSL